MGYVSLSSSDSHVLLPQLGLWSCECAGSRLGGSAGCPQPCHMSCIVETTGLNAPGHWPTLEGHKDVLCSSWEKDPCVPPRLV